MPPTRRLPATAILYREAGRNHARLLTMAGRRAPVAPPPPPVTPGPVAATVVAPGAQPVGGVVVPGWGPAPSGPSPAPEAPQGPTTGRRKGSPPPPPGPAPDDPQGHPHPGPASFDPAPAVAVYGADDPPAPPYPGAAPAASPEAPPVPRRWWAGEDTPGALDLPPPPALWEWWCEVLRRDGYSAATVTTLKAGPPPTPEGAIFPRPGQARIHRAWSGGWSGVYPPIGEVLRAEREAEHRAAVDEARARREAAVQKALDDDLKRQIAMREAHIAATMREGQILDTLRGANLLGAANAVRLNDKLRALIERSMDAWVADGVTLSLADAVKLTRELAAGSRAFASMASTVVETTRLAAGEPTAIVGAAPSTASGANPTDRAQALEAVRHIAALTAAAGVTGPVPEGFAAPGGLDGLEGAEGAMGPGGGVPGDGPAEVLHEGRVVSAYEAAVAVDHRGYRAPAGSGVGEASGPSPVDPSVPPYALPVGSGASGLAGPVVAPEGAVTRAPSHPVTQAPQSAFAPPEAMPVPGPFGGGVGGYGGGYGGAFG